MRREHAATQADLTAERPANSLTAVSEAHRPRLLLLVALVALLGVADGVYLTLVHLDYETGRAGVSTVCHRFSATGCSVTAGRFGDILGVPVATVGAAGALATAVLAAIAFVRRARWEDPFRQAVLVLAALSVAASVAMAVLSTMEGAWCPFCVAWYGINAAMAWLAWRARDAHVGWTDALDDTLGLPVLVGAVVFGTAVAGTMQWYHPHRDALMAERDAALIPELVEELRKSPKHDLDLTAAHRKGATDPEVVIVEFGDFECPHCARLFDSVEQYTAKSSRRVQVVFAHYPLGQSCNPNVDDRHRFACSAAAAAECAGVQGKFWEYAAHLFAHQGDLGREDLGGYAAEFGLDVAAFDRCMVDPATGDRIRADVERGVAVDITGTPTFLINGYKWTGAMPPAVLAGVIDGLLAIEGDAPPPPG